MSAAPVLEDYAAIEGMNWSSLKHIAVSPKLFKYRQEHPREDSKAFRVGRAIHCAVLEPERFLTDYVGQPDFGDLRTKKAKEARAAWRDELSEDVEILPPDEYELAVRCAAEVRAHEPAMRLLEGGRVEEVVTWTDEETGVPCKGRLDLIAPTYILDLKTTRMPTLWRIGSDVAAFRYHAQLAFYFDGAVAARLIPPDADLPRILAVQTVEPYDVAPTHLGEAFLEAGRAHYRSLLRTYLDCRASDWWPGIAPHLTQLPMPQWAAGATDDGFDAEDW